ncbi:kinase-like protein, partial [Fistulina hepatica ATCC 64428]
DLIKGLAYLHELCIAHRDIKPDNLLVDQDFCLKIIDFDLAIQVKDEDEEVSDHCGTKGWEAPEVKSEWPTYSPIKADRWSCGHVI